MNGPIVNALTMTEVMVQFGETVVLEDVTASLAAGTLVGVVGPNGAGKSTLINMICRFYDGTRGTLKIDGIDIRKIKIQDLFPEED